MSTASEWFDAGAKPRGIEWSGDRLVVRAIAQRGNKMAVSLLHRRSPADWSKQAHRFLRMDPAEFLALCRWGLDTFGDPMIAPRSRP